MENPRRPFIISLVLKPDKLEGRFKRKILGIFHTNELTSSESRDIYKYRITYENMRQKYLGTDHSMSSRISPDTCICNSCLLSIFWCVVRLRSWYMYKQLNQMYIYLGKIVCTLKIKSDRPILPQWSAFSMSSVKVNQKFRWEPV